MIKKHVTTYVLVIAASFLLPSAAFSQQQTKDKFSISIDAAALAQQGFGMKVDYAFLDNWTFGIFGKQYESNSEGFIVRSEDPKKYQFSEQGLVVSYFFSSVFSDGIYISLGYAEGKNKVTYYDINTGSLSDEDSDTGAQGKMGYQFSGELKKSHNWLVQFGFGYGACGEGDWELFLSPEQAIYSDLKSGVLLDFNLGMTF